MSSVAPLEILKSATFRRTFGYFFLIWLLLVLPSVWLGARLAEEHEPEDDWHDAVSDIRDWTVELEEDWLINIRETLEDQSPIEPEDEDPWAPQPPDEEDLATSWTLFQFLWHNAETLGRGLAEEVDEDICWRISRPSADIGNLASSVRLEPIEDWEDMAQGFVVENPLVDDDEADEDGEEREGDFGDQGSEGDGRQGNRDEDLRFDQWLAADEEDEFRRCVVRRWAFEGDGELLLGHVIGHERAESFEWYVTRMVGPWALIALLVGFLAAFRLARGPITLVSDLERVRRQVSEGQLSTRLRRRDHGGDLDAAATATNDVLDRLDHAVSMLSEVTDNIAHDLRTPLTRLQGQLDLVRRSETPTPAMIEAVQDEAGQLLATFNALLRIAQVESGSRRKGFRPFDLTPLVTDVGDFYGPAMAEKPLSFSCHVPPEPVQILGDPDLWMQALSNLLDNAMKYTPANGRVYVELRPGDAAAGRPVQIRIRDSGSGIPEHELDKVFQRFYRLSVHRKQKGSGLGLSLVAAICELHRAEIQLENHGGLMVLITIPAAAEER